MQHYHSVQFYEGEEFLVRSVADFLVAGFDVGEPALVIATPEHRLGLAEALAGRGVDVEWSRRRGMLTELDARATLASFMVGPAPDATLFNAQVTPVLEKVRRSTDAARRSAPSVRW